MTSSHEIIQEAVNDTVKEIAFMTSTTLNDAEKLKLMIFYAAQFPYSNDHEQMLGGFGIKPTKRSNANVFYVADLEDAFERYLTHT